MQVQLVWAPARLPKASEPCAVAGMVALHQQRLVNMKITIIIANCAAVHAVHTTSISIAIL